ncbi:MAG: sugar ABC transporter permease [bacterium]|nr:sugar ABC transporter permease [bacterium]
MARNVAALARASRTLGQVRSGDRRFVLAGLIPASALIAALILLPLGFAFYTSWFAWNLKASPRPEVFVGLSNFVRVFTDGPSREVLTNTTVLVATSIVASTVLGLAAALLLSQEFPGRGIVRTSLLLPWAIPGIAAGTMWWWLYSARYGVLNHVLQTVGVIAQPVNWLIDYPMFSVIMANIWKEMPFSALLFLAALQGIPAEIYEAAMVDGANVAQRFLFITMPLLKNITVVILIFQSAAALKMFDLIFTMTLGGPAGATTTLSYWAYVTSFRYWDFGFGSAIAFVTAGLVVVLSGVYLGLLYRQTEV